MEIIKTIKNGKIAIIVTKGELRNLLDSSVRPESTPVDHTEHTRPRTPSNILTSNQTPQAVTYKTKRHSKEHGVKNQSLYKG